MWGDMSLWNVKGPLLHSGDHIVPRILTVDYTFNMFLQIIETQIRNSTINMILQISTLLISNVQKYSVECL